MNSRSVQMTKDATIRKKKNMINVVLPAIVLAGAVLGLLIFYQALVSQQASRQAYEQILTSAREQVTAMDYRLEGQLRAVQAFAGGVVWSEEMPAMPEIRRALRSIREQNSFENVGFATLDGGLMYISGSKLYIGDRDYFQAALKGESGVWYIPEGRTRQAPVFMFAAPIMEGDEAAAVALATHTADQFQEILEPQSYQHERRAFVCDAEGKTVVGASSLSEINAPENFLSYLEGAELVLPAGDGLEEARLNLREGREGVLQYRLGQEERCCVYTPLGIDGLMLVNTVTADYVRSIADAYSGKTIVPILCAIFLTVSVMLYVLLQERRRMQEEHADQMERQESLMEEYHQFRQYRHLTDKNTIGSLYLNLSKNQCGDGESSVFNVTKLQADGTVDGFIERVCLRLTPEDARAFRSRFGLRQMEAAFAQGKRTLSGELIYPLYETHSSWVGVTVEMMKNPQNDDLEALIYAFDIDREKRLQQTVDALMRADYEFLGVVNAQTGHLTVISGTLPIEREMSAQKELNYDEEAARIFAELTTEGFYQRALKAQLLERVRAELEKRPFYTVTYPGKTSELGSACFKQGRFSYMDERRDTILVSRIDVSDIESNETDSLTGLYNQAGFNRHVRTWMEEHPGEPYRVLRFELDGFKAFSGTQGYEVADRLLHAIGQQMLKWDDNGVAARLDADHFVRFEKQGTRTPEEYFSRLSNWLGAYPVDYRLTAHMGVFESGEERMEPAAMCYRALLALSSVKENLTRRIAYYEHSLLQSTVETQALINEMDAALKEGQFEVYFQPQNNYQDGTVIGAEALVRWRHPEKGLISPAVFIPVFEHSNLITTLDEYVWEQCCKYQRKWLDHPERYTAVPISVNISRIDVYHPRLCEILNGLLRKYALPKNMIRLEITESAYMQNPNQLISVVNELKWMGFTVEMDDFGAGYSSLNTLKDVEVDVLKLDTKFLSANIEGRRSRNILSSVIDMAHNMDTSVIAEGVETREQADHLLNMGCHYMQGYHFARPMPAEEFEEYMRRQRAA